MALAPINYTSQVINPLQAMIGGIGQAQQLQQNDQQMEMQRRVMAMQERKAGAGVDPETSRQMFADLSDALASGGDPSKLLARYPMLSEQILESWKTLDSARQQSAARSLGQVHAMLASGNVNRAMEAVDQRIAAAERSGDTRELQELRVYKRLIQSDPEKAKNYFRMVGSVVAPDIFGKMPDAEGTGPFKGTGMDAQAYNVLIKGDPASPEYAAAYSHLSQPRFDMRTQTEVRPDMSQFAPPGSTRQGGSSGAAAGPTVRTFRTREQVESDAAAAQQTLSQIQAVKDNPAVKSNLGWRSLIINAPGGAAADAMAQMEQIENKAFMQAFEMLKGGGAITEKEGAAAANAIARMKAVRENRGSYEAYIAALKEFEDSVRIGARKLGVEIPEGVSDESGREPTRRPPSYFEKYAPQGGR